MSTQSYTTNPGTINHQVTGPSRSTLMNRNVKSVASTLLEHVYGAGTSQTHHVC